MTSMGEMSAARTTIPIGDVDDGDEEEDDCGWDLRSDLTTSLTPRLRVRCPAAEGRESRLARVWRGQNRE